MSSSRTPAMWSLTKLVALFLVCGTAFAQGATPPGTSQDGSRPADGALKGGASIAPGETSGMPDRTPAESAEARKRCDELSGSLREQCLEKERSAATGGTTAPRSPSEILRNPMKTK